MKIILNNKDTLQLTLAIKGGCIDTDKVECLKKLADNYNPPEQITYKELELYLKSLKLGWRLVPLTMSEWKDFVWNNNEEYEGIRKQILDVGLDTSYKRFVKGAVAGLWALRWLGTRRDFSDVPHPGEILKLYCKFFKRGQ